MKGIEYATDIKNALVAIFTIGIVFRVSQSAINMMEGNEEGAKKRIVNYIKAGILVNVISVLIEIVKKYYQ